MAKLTARIPADQVDQARAWVLTEVSPDDPDRNRVFRLNGHIAPGRMDRSVPAIRKHQPGTGSTEMGLSDEPAGATKPALTESESRTVETTSTSGLDIQTTTAATTGEEIPSGAEESLLSGAVAYDDGFRKGETEGYVKGEAEGFAAGEAAGREEGMRLARQAFEQEVVAKRALISELQVAFQNPPDVNLELQDMLVDIVSRMTQLILVGDIKSHPEQVSQLVAAALLALPHGAKNIQVKVNPRHLDFLQSLLSGPGEGVTYLADAALAPGGCVVISEQSYVDASLSHRINDCLQKAFVGEQVNSVSEALLLEDGERLEQNFADNQKLTESEFDARQT